jgi:hypothetical protein
MSFRTIYSINYVYIKAVIIYINKVRSFQPTDEQRRQRQEAGREKNFRRPTTSPPSTTFWGKKISGRVRRKCFPMTLPQLFHTKIRKFTKKNPNILPFARKYLTQIAVLPTE